MQTGHTDAPLYDSPWLANSSVCAASSATGQIGGAGRHNGHRGRLERTIHPSDAGIDGYTGSYVPADRLAASNMAISEGTRVCKSTAVRGDEGAESIHGLDGVFFRIHSFRKALADDAVRVSEHPADTGKGQRAQVFQGGQTRVCWPTWARRSAECGFVHVERALSTSFMLPVRKPARSRVM